MRFVEPGEIAGHAQIVLGAAHDRHIIDAVPWADGLSGNVIGGQVLMHILHEPVFNQAAQRVRIKQSKAQRGERRVPGKTESGKYVAAKREVGGAIFRIGGSAAGKDQILKASLIELPKRFVVGFKLRKIAGEIRIPRSECRLAASR